ncbi:uncharacterized protein [Asterias amurensis]|uniref:uncharacterized protein isoform X2 n=1 Tax=Asterias amurensis TaxID=7602 RepID=UPI003AB49EFA
MSEQPTGNSVPVKRPTIIRAGTKSGSTNIDEEISNQSSNSAPEGDPISQPADNSGVVIRRQPPARPSAGPGRPPVQVKPRPASVHLRPEVKRNTRPASVHLPLSQAPSIKDKPSTGSTTQKKRPEITILAARPLSEVGGFSKDTSYSVPSPALKTPAAPKEPSAVDSTSNHPVAAPRRAANLDVEASGSNPLSVENRSEPPGVTGATNMSGPPPPLPSNRPKGPYIPPPLPSSRPKAAYVHPGSVSSSSITEGGSNNPDPSQPSSETFAKPRLQKVKSGPEEVRHGSSQAVPSRPPQPVNHTSVQSSKPVVPNSEKPVKVLPPVPVAPKLEPVNKPHDVSAVPSQPGVSQFKSHVPNLSVRPKPAEKPAVPQHPVVALKPAEKPSLPHPIAPPKPSQRSVNNSEASTDNQPAADSHKHSVSQPPRPTMPLKPPAAGNKYSRSDILSLFDNTFQKNSKPENKTTSGAAAKNANTESALKFGGLAANAAASDGTRSKNEAQAFQYAGAVAQNTTAEDVNNIGGAMEELRKSEDGHKAVSSFSRIAKSTASDVRSSDSSSGDLKWQVASSAAKNVTADDAKNVGKAGMAVAKSEQGRKAASSIFSIAKSSMNQVNESQKNSAAQNPSARARPKNQGQQSGSGFSMNSLMGLMPPPKTPVQPTPKPATASGHRPAPVPKFKISTEPVKAEGGPRSKPTIIRPGADKPVSKPNSRTSSPDVKRKVPPPRPSAGPGKTKGAAPTRPNAPSNQLKSSSSSQKPKRKAPAKPGAPQGKKPSPSDTLPPRPGPGHPLYNKYMVSEPHGIALYDYKPIQPDELGFKTNDMILLLKRIDADWLKGRCGSSEGLIPAAFLKIIKDIPQTGSKSKSDEPNAVAVFSFEGAASDELRFNEGENIILLDRVGDQWLKGQCRGSTGIFPANHVKVIVDLPAKSTKSDVVSGPRCIAKYDYDSVNPSDLTFKEGSVIKLLDNAGPQWLKGQHKGKTGIFPDSYVDIIEALPSTKKPTSIMNGNSGNVATALYDFEAAESNEISLKEGDRITILGQVNAEWLHGEVRGSKGNFPSGFVDHIPANLPAFTDSPSEIGECIAKFDFEPAAEGELALKVGDRITLLEYIGDDWLRGRLGLRDGIFPKSFVDIVGKQMGNASGTALSNPTCKALYDFYAEEADELTIVNGDVIEILEHVSADWLKGRLKGKTGKFPKAFVDIR